MGKYYFYSYFRKDKVSEELIPYNDVSKEHPFIVIREKELNFKEYMCIISFQEITKKEYILFINR